MTSYNEVYEMNRVIKNDPRLANLDACELNSIRFRYLKCAISYFMYDCRKELNDRVDPVTTGFEFEGDGVETDFLLIPAPPLATQCVVYLVQDGELEVAEEFSYDAELNTIHLKTPPAPGTGVIVKAFTVGCFNEDLDSLPFPARHLVDNTIYRRPDNGKVQAVIKVSRGCPFHCFFCLASPVSGIKVRKRSAENIIAELKECVEKFNITNFLFWSDIFNIDRSWTIDLCKKIIDSGLKITWSANTRADTMDDEMAHWMYKSGCRLVSIGVESGSQEILNNIGKKITLDNIRNTVKVLKKNKIKIYNYFVLGLPWETEKTANETINFAIELDSNFVSFYTAAPLPGTKFFAYALVNKLAEDGLNFDGAYFVPSVRTHSLSKERILEIHKSAVRKFYLRPGFIFKTILSLRSFTEFKNYFRAGMNLIFKR